MALLRDPIYLFPTLPFAKHSTGDIHGKQRYGEPKEMMSVDVGTCAFCLDV